MGHRPGVGGLLNNSQRAMFNVAARWHLYHPAKKGIAKFADLESLVELRLDLQPQLGSRLSIVS